MNNRLVKCIFKEDINIKGYEIKARTEGWIIQPTLPTVNCCIRINVYVNVWDIKSHVLDLTFCDTINDSDKYELGGIVVTCKTKDVAIDISSSDCYYNNSVYDWEIKKVLGTHKVPEGINKSDDDYKYKLSDLVFYMNKELSDWVSKNAIWNKVTQDMLDDGDISSDFEVDDIYLYNIDDFYEEQIKLKERLEQIGYTYEFDGGLHFFD